LNFAVNRDARFWCAVAPLHYPIAPLQVKFNLGRIWRPAREYA